MTFQKSSIVGAAHINLFLRVVTLNTDENVGFTPNF